MTDEPEIERCVCGAEAAFGGDGLMWYAWCTRDDITCWRGPQLLTPEGALAAWIGLMRAAKKRDAAIDERNKEREAWREAIRSAKVGGNLTLPGRPIDARFYVEAVMRQSAKERTRLLEEVAAAHETIVGEWGGVDTLSGEYSGKYAFAHCTCPDCTEHRAREIERTAADRMTTTEESVE